MFLSFANKKKWKDLFGAFRHPKYSFLKNFFVYICVMDENINEEYTLREYLCISSFLF